MARWSDLAVWRGPTPNRTSGGMNRYDGQITHIAAGYFEGTISWQRNDSSNVSSHFVVGREWGECAQMVDTVDAAWTQGDGNGEWISVENAGFPLGHRLWKPGWERLSDWQIECNARLFARGHREYGWPLQLTSHPTRRGLGYHGMGAENGYNWGHLYCPGEPIKLQQDQILKRAIEIVEGDDMPTDDELARLPWTYRNPASAAEAAERGEWYPDMHAVVWQARNAAVDTAAKLDALTAVIEQLAGAIRDGGGTVDTAAILAGVDERLAAHEQRSTAELRDAVADLGEGGSAQVRADG